MSIGKGVKLKEPLLPVGGNTNGSVHNGSQYGESYRSEKMKLPCYPELLPVWGEYLYAKRNEATLHTQKKLSPFIKWADEPFSL